MKPTFDEVLDSVEQFSLDEKEIFADILNKRIILEKKIQLENDVRLGLQDYANNDVIRGSRKDLMKDILS